jgi:catechol 2,3-dioxygenase-like lactoylglutathione lyase family enzyme
MNGVRQEKEIEMSSDGAVLNGATPIFHVANLSEALDWYQKVLGFQIAWTWGDPADLASVCRDNTSINLGVPRPGQFTASRVYIETTGVDTIYSRVVSAGGHVAVPIGNRPHGMRDFRLVDPSGNELSFGEPTA